MARAKDITTTLPAGPVLVIAPHPDDESLGCGGTISLLKRQGQHVRIVIVTDGSAAEVDSSLSPERLIVMRRKELVQAAQSLGVPMEDIVFLSHKDGGASQVISAIANDLASQIWLTPPALVFAPHGIDATADHRAVAAAVQILIDEGKLACPVLDYPMWFWPRGAWEHLKTPALVAQHRKVKIAPFLGQKKAAIDAHETQKGEAHWQHLIDDHIAQALRDEELFFEKPRLP